MAINWEEIYKQKQKELAGSYEKREADLNTAKQNELSALNDILKQNRSYLTDQKDEAMRQAYIAQMNAYREYPETLRRSGLNGGISESYASDLLRTYQNARNSAYNAYTQSESKLNSDYQNNRTAIDDRYSTLFNELSDAKEKDVLNQTQLAYDAAVSEQQRQESLRSEMMNRRESRAQQLRAEQAEEKQRQDSLRSEMMNRRDERARQLKAEQAEERQRQDALRSDMMNRRDKRAEQLAAKEEAQLNRQDSLRSEMMNRREAAAQELQRRKEAEAAAQEDKRRWEAQQQLNLAKQDLEQSKQLELIRQFNEEMAFKQEQAAYERAADEAAQAARAASSSSAGSTRSSSSKKSSSKKSSSASASSSKTSSSNRSANKQSKNSAKNAVKSKAASVFKNW